jgi:hypothetical protein
MDACSQRAAPSQREARAFVLATGATCLLACTFVFRSSSSYFHTVFPFVLWLALRHEAQGIVVVAIGAVLARILLVPRRRPHGVLWFVLMGIAAGILPGLLVGSAGRTWQYNRAHRAAFVRWQANPHAGPLPIAQGMLPVVSPDGHLYCDTTELRISFPFNIDMPISVCDFDGSHERALSIGHPYLAEGPPAFIPGTDECVMSYKALSPRGDAGPWICSLFKVESADQLRELTRLPGVYDPAPSGRLAVHWASPELGGFFGGAGASVVRLDAGRPGKVLIDLPGDTKRTIWSPDSSRLAFTRQDESVLYILQVANSKIATAEGPTRWFGGRMRWSPDGAWIAWGSGTGIHLLNLRGKGLYSLPYACGSAPCWTPDMSYIVYDGSGDRDGPAIFIARWRDRLTKTSVSIPRPGLPKQPAP